MFVTFVSSCDRLFQSLLVKSQRDPVPPLGPWEWRPFCRLFAQMTQREVSVATTRLEPQLFFRYCTRITSMQTARVSLQVECWEQAAWCCPPGGTSEVRAQFGAVARQSP